MIRDELTASLSQLIDVKTIKNFSVELDLFDAGILDSLRILELVMIIETRLNISFHPNEIRRENFKTIKDIENCIERNHSVRN